MRVKKETNQPTTTPSTTASPSFRQNLPQKSYAWGHSPMNQVKNCREVQYHYFGECNMPYSITDGKPQLRFSWYSVWGLAGSISQQSVERKNLHGRWIWRGCIQMVTYPDIEGQHTQAPVLHISLQDCMLHKQSPSQFARLPISRKSLLLLPLS